MRACNSAAAKQTEVVKIGISNPSVNSIVGNIGRSADGDVRALGINTTTVSAVSGVTAAAAAADALSVRSITRDDTAGEIQRDTAVGKNATTGSSLIRCNHAASHVE